MNNKISISKFFEAGGLVEVRLIREVKFLTKEFPLYYCANDMESCKTLWEDIRIPYYFAKSIGINNFERYFENISFSCNGISYTFDKEVGLHDTIFNDMYLYAISKYYRGATI